MIPAYDEFIISYRDRTASLSLVDHKKAVSENGIFYPTILKNGQVIGTWKLNYKKDNIVLTTRLFKTSNPDLNEILFKSSIKFSKFINKKIELLINQEDND